MKILKGMFSSIQVACGKCWASLPRLIFNVSWRELESPWSTHLSTCIWIPREVQQYREDSPWMWPVGWGPTPHKKEKVSPLLCMCFLSKGTMYLTVAYPTALDLPAVTDCTPTHWDKVNPSSLEWFCLPPCHSNRKSYWCGHYHRSAHYKHSGAGAVLHTQTFQPLDSGTGGLSVQDSLLGYIGRACFKSSTRRQGNNTIKTTTKSKNNTHRNSCYERDKSGREYELLYPVGGTTINKPYGKQHGMPQKKK